MIELDIIQMFEIMKCVINIVFILLVCFFLTQEILCIRKLINFICQLDWVTGCCPIFGQTSFPGVSVRVFSEETHIGISELTKSDPLHAPTWVVVIQYTESLSSKRSRTGDLSLPLPACSARTSDASCPWAGLPFGASGSQAFRHRLKLHLPASCVSSL